MQFIKLKKGIILGILILATAACTTASYKKYDSFTGETIYSTGAIQSRNLNNREITVQFRKYEKENKILSFDILLGVGSEMSGHLDVPAGKNLILRADGKDTLLETRGSGQKTTVPGIFAARNIETIAFESLTPEQISEISRAREVKFRLKSINENVDFTIPLSTIRALGPYAGYNTEYEYPKAIDMTPASDQRF
jgi:hypothetical protein